MYDYRFLSRREIYVTVERLDTKSLTSPVSMRTPIYHHIPHSLAVSTLSGIERPYNLYLLF